MRANREIERALQASFEYTMSTCPSRHIKPSVCSYSFFSTLPKTLLITSFRFPLAYCVPGYGSCLWISSTVETNVAIIFTCMHAMRPLLAKLVPYFFSSPSRVSENRDSNEKSFGHNALTDSASTPPRARFNPFASVSGVGRWIARMDFSRATKVSSNARSTVDGMYRFRLSVSILARALERLRPSSQQVKCWRTHQPIASCMLRRWKSLLKAGSKNIVVQ